MTTKEADRIIRAGAEVMVRSLTYEEVFFAVFVRRDRHNIYSSAGGQYDRADLELAKYI